MNVKSVGEAVSFPLDREANSFAYKNW